MKTSTFANTTCFIVRPSKAFGQGMTSPARCIFKQMQLQVQWWCLLKGSATGSLWVKCTCMLKPLALVKRTSPPPFGRWASSFKSRNVLWFLSTRHCSHLISSRRLWKQMLRLKKKHAHLLSGKLERALLMLKVAFWKTPEALIVDEPEEKCCHQTSLLSTFTSTSNKSCWHWGNRFRCDPWVLRAVAQLSPSP